MKNDPVNEDGVPDGNTVFNILEKSIINRRTLYNNYKYTEHKYKIFPLKYFKCPKFCIFVMLVVRLCKIPFLEKRKIIKY